MNQLVPALIFLLLVLNLINHLKNTARVIGFTRGGVKTVTLWELRDRANKIIENNPELAAEPVHFFAGDELADLYVDDQGIVVVE